MTQMQPMGEEPDIASPAQWMVFAVISSIVVGIGIIALIVVGVLPRFTNPRQAIDSPDGPYQTRIRPIPVTNDFWQIFPQQLGEFTADRWDWTGNLEAGFVVRYGRGADTLTISGRQAVSIPAARFLIEDIRNRNGPANTSERIIAGQFNDGHYLDIREGKVRFAWSRDRWFFDITTESIETLNAFMGVFPY
jgi:hypothetical protein